ncbi:hypothetical protein SUGI_0421850 [Cryptomeria japonica]|nr:hypothetical protein SUGI_0421850 [Cryptomeria japonica]
MKRMKRDSILILLFLLNSCWFICECRWSNCNNGTTYLYGGAYSTNLKRVINDLLSNTSDTPEFAISSYGQSPNTVYGLLQCVGNISAEKCSECSKNAYKTVTEQCGNDIGGQVWMDDCFLRYDKFNFFRDLDISGMPFPNESHITSNSQAFEATVTNLLKTLSEKAYEPANKDFAMGSASYSSSGKVYGLVQCWRTLEREDCKRCLLYARQEAQSCCSIDKGAQVLSTSCKIRYEIYPFFGSAESMLTDGSNNPPTSSPPASPAEPHSSGKSSKTLPIILGLMGALILALLICLIAMRKRVASAICRRPITIVTHSEERQGNSSEARLIIQEKHFVFSLEELAESTQNFDESKKLGVGGFGAVYKGTTREGKEIAVKKLSARSTQGKEEFMNEVKLMANVQHRNLVKLFGCCVEGDERLIVYEYLPNKSLDTFLFDPEKRRLLDWEKRYNIIIGVARGLLYLHEDSQMKIIHRDIKANNILLDDKLHPKIADFGLAKLFGEDESHVQTRVAGTYGYMAPEYAMQGQLSVKADVYSFGVLLLEIVSGRKNLDTHLAPGMQNLLEWAWRLYKTLRPPISNVIMMISSSSVTLPNATKPAFVSGSEKNVSKSSSEVEENEKGTVSMTTSSGSVNEASVTAVQSR